jgi:hypothetical protein
VTLASSHPVRIQICGAQAVEGAGQRLDARLPGAARAGCCSPTWWSTVTAASPGLGGTELAAAVRAGRKLTRLAPLRESGYRYLMQALAAQGNLAEALGVYGQLSECLWDQLGVSPSPATRQLYERLLAAT